MTLCDRKMIVAITGGIGAGKSVVSHMLRAMGMPVYDCDAAARRLMDESCEIKGVLPVKSPHRLLPKTGRYADRSCRLWYLPIQRNCRV